VRSTDISTAVARSPRWLRLPPIPDRPHVLEIRFRLDADGVAWVTARDVESGKVVEMKVDTRKVPPTP
jgi:molecular chaperone DnaK (HSP70)